MDWHVQIDGVQSGPHTDEHISQLARSARLRPTDLVWSPGMPGWLPAGQVQPFAAVFSGVPLSAESGRMGDDPLMRMALPVGRSGWAIASGYLGLFSVLVIPAPLAVITGILAIREIRRDSHKHGMGRAIFGIAMGSLFTVVLALMLLANL